MRTVKNIITTDTIKIRVYTGMIVLLYFCYFLIFFGLYAVKPEYIHILSISIQLFICGLLIWIFNPFIKNKLQIYDGQIIFAAALFLLNNVVVTEIETYFRTPIPTIKNTIKTDINKMLIPMTIQK